MLNNILSVFTTQSALAFKKCWMLLLLFFFTELLIQYDVIIDITIIRIRYITIFSLLTSWYFIVNKQWTKAIVTFILNTLFYLVHTSFFIDFIFEQFQFDTVDANDSLAIMFLKIGVLLTTALITSYFYLNTNTKIKRSIFIESILINIIFLFAFRTIVINNDILDLIIEKAGLEFIIHVVYGLLISIYLGSLFYIYYLLLTNYQQHGSLVKINENTLNKISDNFILAFPLLYLALIFTIFYNVFEYMLGSLSYYYFIHTFYEYIQLFITYLTPLVFIIIISQILRNKTIREDSFFGLFGILLYIPIVNLLFYGLLLLNQKYKIFSINKFYTHKVAHVLIGLVLIILYFGYKQNNSYIGPNAGEVITTLVIYVISIINFKKIWFVSLSIAILSLVVFDLSDLITINRNFFMDQAPKSDFVLMLEGIFDNSPKLTVVILLKWISYASYIYILRYSFLTKEEWSE
ncbi:hypothetical protein LNQ81_12325 [Myroides sp. M-43]|uniref:hypothetical protein n=1 Tax=Myroides oncorhynchi TaxID=2893756 RepID=UPI001E575186|nr:hypothetical protein [Myroides oncorhynchi]MCC9043457.1 hypothetical protein [Myroides oncorhynchi]